MATKSRILSALLVSTVLATSAAGEFGPAGSVPLSLSQAVNLAVENNVDVRLAQTRTLQARAKALKDSVDLLPQINGVVSQSRVFKINLAAQGLGDFPGIDPLLGPFNVFDARVSLVQNVFDLSSIWSAKAGRKNIKVARLEEDLAREQVASAAALAYVDLLREARSVEASQADFDLSRSVFDLSRDQLKAGVATGVDVTRSEARQAEANVRLINARKRARQASLRLARVTGLPFDKPIAPTDSIDFSSATVTGFTDGALARAQNDRLELGIANMLVEARENELSSKRAEYAPLLKAGGDVGVSGNDLGNAKRTGSIGARLEVPILKAETQADVRAARADLDEARLRQEDLRRSVEEDLRLAFDTLAAERETVDATAKALVLAEKEMEMAKDRYSSGVGDNIQVITAQNALAQAQDDRINALATFTAARINLGMAMGHGRTFQLN